MNITHCVHARRDGKFPEADVTFLRSGKSGSRSRHTKFRLNRFSQTLNPYGTKVGYKTRNQNKLKPSLCNPNFTGVI